MSSHDISNIHTSITNIIKSGTNGVKIYANSILRAEETTTEDLTGTNLKKFAIGRNNRDNSYYWNGTMQEILLFSSDQTSNRTTIETNVNSQYFSLLLDGLNSAAAAFSLRKLKSSYSGSAVQVRRASDNATQDIGFVNNELDTASLNTFCSGTNGFVTTWYDQSGNGKDTTQSTLNRQPKIYDSSTGVILLNGKPSIEWDSAVGGGTNGMSLIHSNLPGSTSYSISSVFSAVEPSLYTTKLLSIGPDAQTSGVWYAINLPGSAFEWVDGDTGFAGNGYNNASGPSIIGDSRIIPDSITTQNLLTTVLSSSNAKMFKNGSEISYRIQRTGNCYNTTANMIIGNSPNFVNKMNGRLQELIVWQSDEVSNIATINSKINTHYSIY